MEDEQIAIDAVRMGAQDYLTKDHIENEMLIRAIRYAMERKRLDLLKAEFVNAIAHEIRTPLTIIKSGIDNMKDGLGGRLSKDHQKTIELVSKNINRLAKVVKGAFTFQLLETDRSPERKQAVKLDSLIHTDVEKFREEAKKKRVQLKETIPQFLPTLYGDAEMLTEALDHLLDNAVRFANGEVSVHTGSDGQFVKVTISDDGPGLTEEKLEQLFQIFSQIDRPQGGAGYKGIGLGLAVCKEIIERHHNGKTWAEKGKRGLKMNFTLPIEQAVGSKHYGKKEKSLDH